MQRDHLKTLAVVSQKGGVGKSSLVINIAVQAARDGLSVAIVDCDPQRSAAGWWRIREADWPTLIERGAHELPDVLATLSREGFDLAIIDTRPSVEGETLRAVQNATAAIIPTRPSTMDLGAVALTAQLVRSVATPGCIVLNQCPAPSKRGEPTLTAGAREVASSLGLPVAPEAIALRAAIPYAANDGLAACEYEPGGKAAEELHGLWRHIQKEYLNG